MQFTRQLSMTTEIITDTQNVSTDLNFTTTPVYDYEIENSPPIEELVPVSLAYGITLLLGIAGNGLVIFSVSRYEQLMTITNTFLLSLATADLLLVLVCVPVKFAAFFSYIWRFGEFLCKTIHYIQNVSAICSVATLTFMSLERYYAIVHPLRSKYVCTTSRARKAILCLWVASFILAIPILIGRVHLTVGIHRNATWCVKWFQNKLVGQLYEVYMFCLILLLPVIIMSFAYYRICRELWFMSQHRLEIRAPSVPKHKGGPSPYGTPLRYSASEKTPVLKVKFSEDDNTKKQINGTFKSVIDLHGYIIYNAENSYTISDKKKVVKMLVAVVVVFIICWAPILTNNILVSFGVLPELHIPPYKYMREAFHLMSYANSCVNPIVYGFMSRNFRQTFKRAVCTCLRGRQYIRKMTFKNQRWAVNEKWHANSMTRQSELVSTDMVEMTEVNGEHSQVCLQGNGKVML